MTASAKPHPGAGPGDATRTDARPAGLWAQVRRWWRRVVLGKPARSGRSRRERPDEGDEAAPSIDRMRRDLRQLFSRVRGSRYVLRHLAVLEHAMKRKGEAAFEDLPLAVLRQAAVQLESLIEPPVSAGVAALRSRLGVTLLARERMARADPNAVVAGIPSVPPRRADGPSRAAMTAAAVSPNAMADTQPAVLVRERISAYVAEGHIEISEASVSDFEKAVTDFDLMLDLPVVAKKAG